MADPIYCPILLGAPCLSSAVWAAWWQAALSVLAIGCAIYVPLRMRAIEEADNMLRVRNLVREAVKIADLFADSVRTDGEHYYPPKDPAFETVLASVKAATANHATPAQFLPALLKAATAGDRLEAWRQQARNMSGIQCMDEIKHSEMKGTYAPIREALSSLDDALASHWAAHRLTLIGVSRD